MDLSGPERTAPHAMMAPVRGSSTTRTVAVFSSSSTYALSAPESACSWHAACDTLPILATSAGSAARLVNSRRGWVAPGLKLVWSSAGCGKASHVCQSGIECDLDRSCGARGLGQQQTALQGCDRRQREGRRISVAA